MNIIDNDLLSIQEARILAENAYHAQQWLALLPQEQLDTFVEAMADAAVSLGIKRDDALKIAAATVMGSGKLCLDTKTHPAVLKDQVCSPGGTTIAGVMALEENGLRNAVIKSVLAADEKTKLMQGGK